MKWRTNLPTYARVQYSSTYPGIDVVYHGSSQQQLEYDFVVRPQADPNLIRLSFDNRRAGVERQRRFAGGRWR